MYRDQAFYANWQAVSEAKQKPAQAVFNQN